MPNVLEVCDRVQTAPGVVALNEASAGVSRRGLLAACGSGYRVVGVATKAVPPQADYGRTDESELVFAGFLLFVDPPKPGAKAALISLRRSAST